MTKKIILIGGSPTAGKSFVAQAISESLKLPWISTDTIREQMKEIVPKKDYPTLFLKKDPVEFLTKNSISKIIEFQNKESTEVWRGVKAIIDTNYVWDSYIIEGVAILPQLVSKLNQKEIRSIFLVDEDIDRVRETIFTRGLWDYADKYPDTVKEKEVEWVMEFNEFIKREAKKHGYPFVSVGNRKDYVTKIKRLVK